jgi:hypothetical protein
MPKQLVSVVFRLISQNYNISQYQTTNSQGDIYYEKNCFIDQRSEVAAMLAAESHHKPIQRSGPVQGLHIGLAKQG